MKYAHLCNIIIFTQNHTIERIWVEVNRRVNYPLKTVLVKMMDQGELVMDAPIDQYCTSWFSIQVANVGISLFMSSWNQHPIPNKLIFAILLCN